MDEPLEPGCPLDAGFVAVNFITCAREYVGRFKYLFTTRAKAIDRMAGFCGMQVLEPTEAHKEHQVPQAQAAGGAYLIVSYWRTEDDFKRWMGSPEFAEGHKRGFEDIRAAKARGEESPLKSQFVTYSVIAR